MRTVYGQRTARATTNKFDSESLRRVVAESSLRWRASSSPIPELLPHARACKAIRSVERYFEATAAVTPAGPRASRG